MATRKCRSRIHLSAAAEAPIIVILQRVRARLFHVITVHTETMGQFTRKIADDR